MKTIREKLADRLAAEGYAIDPTTLIRLRPGYWQRTEGAWSWLAVCSELPYREIGSQIAMGTIARAKHLHISYCQGSGNQYAVDTCDGC